MTRKVTDRTRDRYVTPREAIKSLLYAAHRDYAQQKADLDRLCRSLTGFGSVEIMQTVAAIEAEPSPHA